MRQLFAVLGVAVALVATGCSKKPDDAPKPPPLPPPTRPDQPAPGADATTPPAGSRPMKIGVTLHPYYSWTANVVKDIPGATVVALLPGEVDAGNYQPSTGDIAKIADLDAIVINGIGHDDFVKAMIKASGNTKLVEIAVNADTPTMPSAHGTSVNSHTFISFTNAIQQSQYIATRLAALRPEDAAALQANADAYGDRLAAIRTAAATRLAGATIKRAVTVHDGYSYLLQEFGIEVAGVVEPSHGLTPSAKELTDMIELMKQEQIKVVFTEETFPAKLLATLKDGTGANVYIISHVAKGDYAADEFEKVMQDNANVLIKALVEDPEMTAIAIDHVSVTRDRRPVLDDVSLAVAPGTVHVVMGPNGAGKSTLMSAMLGMVPFTGAIKLALPAGARVAWVPQSFTADRTLPITVDEFLALRRQRRPVCLGIGAAARRRIDGILDRVGLAGMGRRRMGELSGGELRRALIGNAIEPAPEILLCDEPATGLDPAAVQQLDQTLLGLCKDHGTAVLLVSHDPAQVERVAAEVTVLDVKVRARGPAREALAALAEAAWRRPQAAA